MLCQDRLRELPEQSSWGLVFLSQSCHKPGKGRMHELEDLVIHECSQRMRKGIDTVANTESILVAAWADKQALCLVCRMRLVGGAEGRNS